MKNIPLILILTLFMSVFNSQDVHAETTDVIRAKLEKIEKNALVFNGRSYSFNIDQKKSLLAMDESEPPEMKIRDLKVGQYYYFEIYSNKREAKNSDFKRVIYVSETYEG